MAKPVLPLDTLCHQCGKLAAVPDQLGWEHGVAVWFCSPVCVDAWLSTMPDEGDDPIDWMDEFGRCQYCNATDCDCDQSNARWQEYREERARQRPAPSPPSKPVQLGFSFTKADRLRAAFRPGDSWF